MTTLGRPARGELDQALAVGDRRAQRLLDQGVEVGGEDVGDDVDVRVVRRDDDDGVAEAAGEQVAVVVEHAHAVAGGAAAVGAATSASVSAIGGDDGAGDGADVLDVLDAHHPGADDPVAGRGAA